MSASKILKNFSLGVFISLYSVEFGEKFHGVSLSHLFRNLIQNPQ